MCGIAGIIDSVADSFKEKALNTMHGRGPDGHGSIFFENESFLLLHSRLSILDLDDRSSQPMTDSTGRYYISFNGEIYNYKELKRELSKKYTFNTTSDTEVVLYGYIEYRELLWSKLSGIFALCIFDKSKGEILCARDYAGIKPLYYSIKDGKFAFASDMKTLSSVMGSSFKTSNLDTDSLKIFFTLGYVPSPKTIYTGVAKLEKSSVLTYSLKNKKLCIKRYEPYIRQTVNSQAHLQSEIEKSIIEQTMSDVPVGLFFSGGTDSSLIASVLKKHDINLRTYSLKMPGRDEDFLYGNTISDYLKLDREVFIFNDDSFRDSYERVLGYVDEPISDVSIFPGDFISFMSSKEVKVVLSGEGGDELFFGYPRHKKLSAKNIGLPFMQDLVDLVFDMSPVYKGKEFLYQKMSTYTDPASLYASVMSIGYERDVPSFKKVVTLLRSLEISPLYFDREMYLENNLLRKLDMNTMGNSVEGRVPLLSPVLYSESKNFIDEFINKNELKPILKSILSTYIPDNMVYRQKSGFGFNLDDYLSNDYVVKDLEDSLSFLQEEVGLFTNLSNEEIKKTNARFRLSVILAARSIINTLST